MSHAFNLFFKKDFKKDSKEDDRFPDVDLIHRALYKKNLRSQEMFFFFYVF